MERHERQTRKPRLFRLCRYQKTSAAMLLTLGSQLAVASTSANVQADVWPVVVEARVAQLHEELSTAVQMRSHLEGPTSRPGAMPSQPRSRIGWAFALLLAGIAVGRHTAVNDAEPD